MSLPVPAYRPVNIGILKEIGVSRVFIYPELVNGNHWMACAMSGEHGPFAVLSFNDENMKYTVEYHRIPSMELAKKLRNTTANYHRGYAGRYPQEEMDKYEYRAPRHRNANKYTTLGEEIYDRVLRNADKGDIETVLRDLAVGYFELGKAVGQAGYSVTMTGDLAKYIHAAQAEAAAIIHDRLMAD